MFLRKKKNSSGSISVQIISKSNGKYTVLKTIGSSISEQEVQKLWFIGKQELDRLSLQSQIFVSENDLIIEKTFDTLTNASIKTVGPEIIFGKIYDFTAYCVYKELERILYKEKSTLSVKKATELTHNMYEIYYTLPESKHLRSQLLKMDDQQAELYQIICKNF